MESLSVDYTQSPIAVDCVSACWHWVLSLDIIHYWYQCPTSLISGFLLWTGISNMFVARHLMPDLHKMSATFEEGGSPKPTTQVLLRRASTKVTTHVDGWYSTSRGIQCRSSRCTGLDTDGAVFGVRVRYGDDGSSSLG